MARRCPRAAMAEGTLLLATSSVRGRVGVGAVPSLCSSMGPKGLFCVPRVFMSLPRIIPKKDHHLDAVMEVERRVRPVLEIRDMVLKAGRDGIPMPRGSKRKERKKKSYNFSGPVLVPSAIAGRYPDIFQVYVHPRKRRRYCRLTERAAALWEEELRVHAEQELSAVERLRKLLMMFPCRRTLLTKLESVRGDLGLPPRFLEDMVPKYLKYFRFVDGSNGKESLELVAWDEALAVSEVERKAKEEAREKGLGDIPTQGQPLAFRVSYSRGMFLRRKILELLEELQKLPYISPYQDATGLEHGTLVSEKRNVAVLHELLWLTVEKKGLLKFICTFRADLGLPNKIFNLIKRYPGIFYVSYKGAIETCILREGYCESKLVEEHPLVQIKAKYAEIVMQGSRLQAKMKQQSGDVENVASQLGIESPPDDDLLPGFGLEAESDEDIYLSPSDIGSEMEDEDENEA